MSTPAQRAKDVAADAIATTPVQEVDSSEATPLLRNSSVTSAGAPRWGPRLRLSPVALITPVAILFTLATYLPTTTVFDIFRKVVCRYWYLSNDPEKIPADGSLPSALCSIPAVDQRYSTVQSATAVVEGIASLVAYGLMSSIANKYGRRPALLTAITFSICADVFILSTAILPDALVGFALLLWLLCQAMAVVHVFGFIMNTYIVDLVPAEHRTVALSRISGFSTVGTAISLSLGGAITTHFQDAGPVYIIALILQTVNFLYICILIPETLQKGQQEDDTPQDESAAGRDHVLVRVLRNCRDGIFSAFLPLKTLRPTRNPLTGKLNKRLLYCGINVFIVGVGDGYVWPALIVYLTTQYDYTPQESGYVLTAVTVTTIVVLTFVIPLLVRRFLRPLYIKTTHLSAVSNSDSVSEVADEMDVHMVIGSLLVQVIALLLVTIATSRITQLGCIILYGFSAGRGPVLRSLVVSTVPAEQHSQALAATEMCMGFGMLLSPVILGSIMSATISTVPQAVFYVVSGIIGVSSLILLFVKDSDRYQHVHEE